MDQSKKFDWDTLVTKFFYKIEKVIIINHAPPIEKSRQLPSQ
jgi:hypothetical protein